MYEFIRVWTFSNIISSIVCLGLVKLNLDYMQPHTYLTELQAVLKLWGSSVKFVNTKLGNLFLSGAACGKCSVPILESHYLNLQWPHECIKHKLQTHY